MHHRSSSRGRKGQDFQFVWPRDTRRNGSKKRTFLQAWSDLIMRRGPDIFITRAHDKTPITSETWGNWAGYHSPQEHAMDRLYSIKGRWGIGNADRGKGYKRYDPHARRYVEWECDQNWGGEMHMMVPRFTRKEHEMLARREGRRLKGKDFVHGMPKRLGPEYADFWQRARRIADNRNAGYMDETDNIRADRYKSSLLDRAHGTPGLSRRHMIATASSGRPDFWQGGPAVRRQWTPMWGDYDMRRDNRGWGSPDQSWDEEAEMNEMDAIHGGMAREEDYRGPGRYYR